MRRLFGRAQKSDLRPHIFCRKANETNLVAAFTNKNDISLGDKRFLKGFRQVLGAGRSEEHTSELQSRENLVCRLLLEKKKKNSVSITTRLGVSSIELTAPNPQALLDQADRSLYAAKRSGRTPPFL